MGIPLLLSLFITVSMPFAIWNSCLAIRCSAGLDRSKNIVKLLFYIILFMLLGLWDGWRLLNILLDKN